ncbi:MAG: flagellin [Rhodoferax sp.]
MTVINTNVKALYTQSALKISDRQRTTAMAQLSTGKRINSAKDDAAGLAIVGRMAQHIKSLNQAVRNAGDAISLIQTTEGATNEITNMLQRMSELALQSSNATYSPDQRGYLDLEFQQLKQEIVHISETTAWNDFPVLNGSAGAPVGPLPVYKTSAQGSFTSGPSYSAGMVTTANTGTITMAGLAKSGSVSISVTSATAATATVTLADGTSSTMTGAVVAGPPSTITFSTANTALNGLVITSTSTFASGQSLAFNVSRSTTAPAAMQAGDLNINGTSIGASATGSAIDKVAAINVATPLTHVTAVADHNVMSGSAMSGSSALSGTVSINGFVSAPISTSASSHADSRAAVISAINAISDRTGVIASDSGADSQGVVLTAADGRNVDIAFNTAASATSFAAATGLKEGLQSAGYALANVPEQAIVISNGVGGAIRSGLSAGSFTNNQSSISTGARAEVSAAAATSHALGGDDLTINGVAIRAASATDDLLSAVTTYSLRAASGIALAAAINASSAQTGVTANANPVTTSGSTTTVGTATGAQSLFVNGVNVQVTLATTETAAERRLNVVSAINLQTGQHGVTASDNGNGGITLSTGDGRNLSVWFNTTSTNLTAASFGLGSASGVTAIPDAVQGTLTAATLYGSVSLISDNAIQVEPGANGFGTGGDFTALGLQAGSFGGAIDPASGALPPQRAGRMSFQVGASANQVITIELADFGKNGTITGGLTADVGQPSPLVNINSVEAANAVLDKINVALDRVSATRATMGAVMNRLEHVIDNLTNVSVNTEASRSRIEDADYAAASTELARTQIMQQAATAVLAQANTDQQTVMKLLQ